MKIALMTIGTRGDVQPFVALALELRRRGHEVALAAPPNARSFVESRGIAFRELGLDMAALLSSPEFAGRGGSIGLATFMRMRKRIDRELFARVGAQAPAIIAGMDVVVYKTPLAPILGLCGEAHVPCLEAALVPLLPTRRDAGILCSGRDLGAPLNLALTSAVDRLVSRGSHRPAGMPILNAVSELVYPRPGDWPDEAIMTGYWTLPREESWTPSPELEAFLAAGDKPVYFGFGSMTNGHADRSLAAIRESLARLGLRGIVAAGWSGFASETRPNATLFQIDSVPHDWLFPRVAAAVHHGGAGTSAAAVLAGLPSVIVPHLGDQAMWARRLWKLGVAAKPVTLRHLSGESLSRALGEALDGLC